MQQYLRLSPYLKKGITGSEQLILENILKIKTI